MTKKLLMHRWEVTADYPNSIFRIGEIIESKSGCIFCDLKGPRYDDFPAIFRKLEWWENKDIAQYPKYVLIKSDYVSLIKDTICEVIEWGSFPDEGNKHGNEGQPFALIMVTSKEDTTRMHVKHLAESTEEEFLDYIKSK